MEFSKYLSPKYILTFSIANYLQSGISFLVTLLLARELGKEDFGYFSYGMVFANTLFIIMQFGICLCLLVALCISSAFGLQ